MEIHQIVEFIFKPELHFLAVTGPLNLGKQAIITEAVVFGIQRHELILNKNVLKVDLNGIKDLDDAIVRIAAAVNP